ncbi:thioredoxin 1 [Sporothrix schenckii 1099-18]|uniref:Thioredoxin n=2 Tax=Sporothrix schenckii TaxID=29908 RepID=U7PPC9_SPOS1|nr:thioredoxin 1 [Sporothrix schenckii 1099-18]ERS97422.1 thioredoxin [Sporothrix schenckii ATCC 58251]KJR81917.1 thioredoxin 1 [Sporothrix schenckii 1099-18]
MSVTQIETFADFKALLAANKFVIADFTADWCGPCKAIAPLYTKLATENGVEGGLAFAKINVDNVPDVAQEYAVSAMPTFLFFADGERASINVAPRKPGATAESEEADPAGKRVVDLIRGADPRALTAAASRLGEAARAAKE